MKTLSLTFLATATLIGSIPAQGVAVFPGDHADPNNPGTSIPGASANPNVPLAWGIARQMMVYESWDLAIPNGARIRRLGFAGDSASTGFQIRLQVFMGPSSQTAATTSTTYASNYSGPKSEVYTRKILSLPNISPAQQLWIPLDNPLSFDKRNNLAVEYVVDANSNGNAAFTYWLDVGTSRSPVRSFGTACQSSGGRTAHVQSSPTTIGSTWFLNLSGAPASSPAFLNIAFSALQTPINVPLTNNCTAYVAPLVTLGGSTNTGGSLGWSAPVPNDLRFFKAKLFSQALIADVFANQLGFVFSDADEIQFGVEPRATWVGNQSDLTQPNASSISRNFGLISLFDWQP